MLNLVSYRCLAVEQRNRDLPILLPNRKDIVISQRKSLPRLFLGSRRLETLCIRLVMRKVDISLPWRSLRCSGVMWRDLSRRLGSESNLSL